MLPAINTVAMLTKDHNDIMLTFENGKETVELGLVLRALSAAGVVLLIASNSSAESPAGELEPLDLDSVLEATGFDVRKR